MKIAVLYNAHPRFADLYDDENQDTINTRIHGNFICVDFLHQTIEQTQGTSSGVASLISTKIITFHYDWSIRPGCRISSPTLLGNHLASLLTRGEYLHT